jgi:serine protease AprX
MALEIPRSLVEFILLGPEDDRRQLQDSPVLGDVWVAFAQEPGQPQELLITPHKDYTAGKVASLLAHQPELADAEVAFLQGVVAARLTFAQVLRFVLPVTYWWNYRHLGGTILKYVEDQAFPAELGGLLNDVAAWRRRQRLSASIRDIPSYKRYMALAALILWAEDAGSAPQPPLPPEQDTVASILAAGPAAPAAALRERFAGVPKTRSDHLVWTLSLNRPASPAIKRSVPAVKADAAATLFEVDCRDIVWAVIDSGIDGSHPAFFDAQGKSRVRRSFDFTRIRDIVSAVRKSPQRIAELLHDNLLRKPGRKEAAERLDELAQEAREGRSIDWDLVEPFVEIRPETPPRTDHGTHVAGIIGASKRHAPTGDEDWADGMCPNIQLWDFRVLASDLAQTEFAIIAALQYIRHVNERHSFMTVHGANLSLSIRHDVRNYACGRTPVCNECERLVNSGVVVVAAAGNRGYQSFETLDGQFESYAAFSITDPGNADGVITVGATHRFWPHTYGVSFFSSRGPTGDGRLKPDLVAPGERIRAPIRGGGWGDLDGTSMAAPHVSGAAAMLMARYSELVGQPRRVKQILCQSATDLGRERTFQGHGMLDVLRAFQSI